MRSIKKYNTMYKKRVLERDCYVPRRSPKEIIQCTGCGAFYFRRRWTLTPPGGFITPVHAHPTYCPACTKTRERFPGGELHLIGVEAASRNEIARIVRDEEERAAASLAEAVALGADHGVRVEARAFPARATYPPAGPS